MPSTSSRNLQATPTGVYRLARCWIPRRGKSRSRWGGCRAFPRWEKNWLRTPKGKGYFAILRLYGPLEPALDKTWVPGDFEKVSVARGPVSSIFCVAVWHRP
jgi:transposase InsO family protein